MAKTGHLLRIANGLELILKRRKKQETETHSKYDVVLDGKVIVTDRDPEFVACRVLVAALHRQAKVLAGRESLTRYRDGYSESGQVANA
jgi:hypothetical protein